MKWKIISLSENIYIWQSAYQNHLELVGKQTPPTLLLAWKWQNLSFILLTSPPLCLDNKGNWKGENVKTSKFCKVLPWWSQDSCLSRHDLWMKYIWVWGQFKGHYLWSTKTIYCQPNGIQTSSSTDCPHSSPRARLGIDDELWTLVPDAVGVVVDVLPGEPCWPLVVHVMELVVPLWAHSW